MTKKQLIFLFVLIILWFAGFIAFNHRIEYGEPKAETKADAIVVLTGGRNRLSVAFELLNKNKADKLFISGVFKDTSLNDLQKRIGITIDDHNKVILDKKSANTVENAKITSQWIQENKISSIYLVTSNYHLPRSIAEFRYYNHNLEILPYPVYSEKVAKFWWKNWHSFVLLAGEYNKFLYVLIRDGLVIKKEG